MLPNLTAAPDWTAYRSPVCRTTDPEVPSIRVCSHNTATLQVFCTPSGSDRAPKSDCCCMPESRACITCDEGYAARFIKEPAGDLTGSDAACLQISVSYLPSCKTLPCSCCPSPLQSRSSLWPPYLQSMRQSFLRRLRRMLLVSSRCAH